MNIAEIRQKYPQYDDLSDEALVKGLHDRFYSDMDFGEFSQKIGLTPGLNLSDAQKAQIAQNNTDYESRQERNRPWADQNPIGRLGVAITQGIANSGLNPAGYIARAAGVDTKPFTPKNAVERGAELAGQYGYDAAAIGNIGNIAKGAGYLGKGKGLVSSVAQKILAPTMSEAVVPAVGAGMLTGAANPSTETARFVTDMIGASIPAFAQGSLGVNTKKLTTGLKNILGNEKANAAVSKGIKANESIARKINEKAPQVYNELNDDMENALKKAAGRKLNINRAQQNQERRYADFIGANADVELLDYSPTRERLRTYPAQSKFNEPKTKLSPEDAEMKLRERAAKSGIEIDGDITHYTDKRGRGQYVRTLSNTLENPDVAFTNGEKDYIAKKYNTKRKPFFDFVIKKDGKLYNKFDTDAKYIDNQIQKTAENVSLGGSLLEPTDAGYIRPAQVDSNIVTNNRVIVNRNLPRVSDYTEGLNEFQKRALNQALDKGAYMSTNAKGSLGATHRGQEVLNDMISSSYDTSILGQKRPTTETRQLMEVKERLNQILERGGVKPYDRGISKAKALQDNFERGYKFKPSETKFENIGLKTRRDRQAFLQGRIAKILDNTLSDGGTNLAAAVKKDENTLRKLIAPKKFESLMKKANELETNFDRLNSFERQAKNRLVKETTAGSSSYRENFDSKLSWIGRLMDKIEGLANRGRNARIANQYLSDGLNSVRSRGGLMGGVNNTYSSAIRQALINELNQ
mgnify:CR=1 FL=1